MPSKSPDVRDWLREQSIDPDSPEGRWLNALLTAGAPAGEDAPAPEAERPQPAA
jgi:hypothetical protein